MGKKVYNIKGYTDSGCLTGFAKVYTKKEATAWINSFLKQYNQIRISIEARKTIQISKLQNPNKWSEEHA